MSHDNELPEGWRWTTLGTIAAINPGLAVSALSDETPVSFVPMAAVEAGTGRMDGSTPRLLKEVKRGYTAFQEGDVLFAKITPCMENGKAAVAHALISGIGFGSTEFHVLRPEPGVDAQLLYYYVSQESFRQSARASMTGSAGQLRVPSAYLAEVPYPIPPLSEQQRIVAAIEQQFTRLDAGVSALKSAQTRLKRYRAAVLKAAVEGKLTEAWRAEHPDAEPAPVLLQRILAERRAKWEADLRAKGKDPAKVRYEEPTPPDTTDLPKLPERWKWARAEQLCDFITKGTTPAANKLSSGIGDIPFIKVYNLTFDGRLDFTVNPTFISANTHNDELTRSRVFPGDVLMNIVGPPLGKVSIIPDQYPEWNINQAIAVFRSMPSYSRGFLALCLRAEQVLSWATSRAKATAGQFNLTLEICRDLPLPLPPLAEQEHIADEVEQRLSVVSELEATVEANLKRAERLRQSILREAFAGRLVPQDPNDEPASVLLKRIRGERENNGRATKKERATKKGKEREAVVIDARPVERVEAQQVSLWEE